LVGNAGKLTGEYEENPRHGVKQDDFSKLTDPGHIGGGFDAALIIATGTAMPPCRWCGTAADCAP
jgi:hypothetical protein